MNGIFGDEEETRAPAPRSAEAPASAPAVIEFRRMSRPEPSRESGSVNGLRPEPAREMPYSEEAEQHVIACCLLDNGDTLARCMGEGLRVDSFYDHANALLFSLMQDMWTRNIPLELETLAQELRTTRNLEAVGGFPYLIQVTGRIPTTAHAGYFIEKVREKKILREVIKACTGAVEQAYAFSGGMSEFTARVSASVTRAISTGGSTGEETIQAVAKVLAEENRKFKPGDKAEHPDAVSWTLVDLDRRCGKMNPGELVVLAGRPSTGKSALADQAALGCAMGGRDVPGRHVLMFTYEMTKRDKAIRFSQQLTSLNFNHRDAMAKADLDRVTESFEKISKLNTLHVFENDTDSVRMEAKARALAARCKVSLVVVDFLQYLARLEMSIGRERTDEKIGRITAACKNIAKGLQVPVLLLSSLSRGPEIEGRPPQMSDLRNSGEIESDADVVAFLHWPKTTPAGVEQDAHDSGTSHFYVEFIQEKGRNKGVHTMGTTFDRWATRFMNFLP